MATPFDPHAVQALNFDVFGTVVDWRTGIARAGRGMGRKHGIAADWEAFADAWRGQYQPQLEKVRSGSLGWTPLDTLHRLGLNAIAADFGLEGLSDAEREALVRAWHKLDPWPDVVAGLDRLHERYLLATLSNGSLPLLAHMAKRAGLPWDAILGPPVVKHYKPQPEAYRLSAELLELEPAACMLVAAHPSDLEAAQAVGFRTAYVHRPREYGAGRGAPWPRGDAFDLVCESFEELADRMAD